MRGSEEGKGGGLCGPQSDRRGDPKTERSVVASLRLSGPRWLFLRLWDEQRLDAFRKAIDKALEKIMEAGVPTCHSKPPVRICYESTIRQSAKCHSAFVSLVSNGRFM